MRISDWSSDVCSSDLHFSDGAKAELRHDLTKLFRDEEEIVDDIFGLAGKARAQHRVLRRNADRAGVQMTFAHHDAPGGDQRRGCKAELVRAQQRADRDVAAGAKTAVHLPGDAAAQAVRSEEHTSELQSLMRTSYAIFCLKQNKR